MVFTEEQAWHWFVMLCEYDLRVSPTRWCWGPVDHAANSVINDAMWKEPRKNWLGRHKRGETLYNVLPRPTPASDWRSPDIRIPYSATPVGWLPRYFPDNTDDYAVLISKHTGAVRTAAAEIEYIDSVLQLFGKPVMDYTPMIDLDEGEFYFSLAQYTRFHDYVAREVSAFATRPEVRQELFQQWTRGCLAWSAELATEYAKRGPLIIIPANAVELLNNGFVPKSIGL